MNEIAKLASRFGLSMEDLAALLRETDAARGMVEPADVGAAIEELARVYLQALAAAAARFSDPAERMVADKVANLAGELLAEQLASVCSPRN